MCCRMACGSIDGIADTARPAGGVSFEAGVALAVGAGGGAFSLRPHAAGTKMLQTATRTTTLRMICHFMRILMPVWGVGAVRAALRIRYLYLDWGLPGRIMATSGYPDRPRCESNGLPALSDRDPAHDRAMHRLFGGAVGVARSLDDGRHYARAQSIP